MLVEGIYEGKKGNRLRGKPYVFDTLSDSMYIQVRPNPSAYSEFKEVGDDGLYLVDFDEHGIIVSVTVENFLSRAATFSPKARLGVLLFNAMVSLAPVGAVANNASSYAKKLINGFVLDNRMKMDVVQQFETA